jgi:periplasmic protein TonB
VKDGGEVFNQEVVRVLKKMPRWNPGKMGNKQVTSYYSIPVVFTASE